MAAAPDYRQHLEVETPEHVILDYEIAGLGSRAYAALVDTIILVLSLFGLLIIVGLLTSSPGEGWTGAIMGVVVFASVWGYFTFFEGFRNGQTPGKRQAGIRVVRETGHAVTFGAAAVRNLVRIADFLPPPYLVGAIFVALHPRARRLGDLVAGTVVVRDRPAEVPDLPRSAAATAESDELAGVPELEDDEFRLLREYHDRAAALPADVRARVANGLARRFVERFPQLGSLPEPFLAALHQQESARRRGRYGGRGTATAGTASGANAGGVSERLVARKSARWDEFGVMAQRATSQGLDSFAAAELPDFAARYREIAADLARARTYRAQPSVLARLGRLVAAGHNALYRDERNSGLKVWTYLLREAPSGIVEAWRAVLLAFVIFMAPALGSYTLLREQPALAEEVVPQGMLERAEAGRERAAAGKGYYEAGATDRPLMASQIMTNNIQVAFFCFAGGAFAGVGSLVLLAFNGLSFGAVSGHFANVGLLGYLYTFVIGHGVVELFAIWVAGAAGFLLGKAMIAPGELSRGEALTLTGRLALKMVTAVILLLVVAGLIEGFVSAGTGPLEYRLAISGASVALLIAYLVNGWLYLRSQVKG